MMSQDRGERSVGGQNGPANFHGTLRGQFNSGIHIRYFLKSLLWCPQIFASGVGEVKRV